MHHEGHDAAEGSSLAGGFHQVQQLGDCHATIGNYAQARRHYEKAAGLAPDEPRPYVGLGVVALLNNQIEDAEIAFRVACRLDPACSKAYAGLALIEQQRGHFKAAFDLYLRSLELDTDDFTALLGLFQTSCQMGSFAKVIHYLQVYLNGHPADTSVMFCLAALYMKDGRLEESRQVLTGLVAMDPDNKDATNLLEEVDHILAQQSVADDCPTVLNLAMPAISLAAPCL
jgi:Flp pilus assembly protein TadD